MRNEIVGTARDGLLAFVSVDVPPPSQEWENPNSSHNPRDNTEGEFCTNVTYK